MALLTRKIDCPNPKCRDGRIHIRTMGRRRVEWQSKKCTDCAGKGHKIVLKGT